MAQKVWTNEALVASDFNTYLTGEGGAWTSWTPTVTQSGSVTVTNTRSRYARYGRLIIATWNLAVTGSGTGSNAVIVSLPVTAAAASVVFGSAQVFDTSAAQNYLALPYLASTTTVSLYTTSTDAADPRLGLTSFTAALASGDQITGTAIYEAAS
jgi:hypothetical protein